MAVTYTRATDRARRRERRGPGVSADDLLLWCAIAVAALTIAICAGGRMTASALVESQASEALQPVNLTTIESAAALEPAMARVFENSIDRQFAARELFGALARTGGASALPNVGALALVRVPASSFEKMPAGTVFGDRYRLARDRAGHSALPPTSTLFTAADVSALKPSVVVRTRDAYGLTVLWCAVGLLGGFVAVAAVWRIRRVPGDRVLLVASLLLTTLGFVVMVGRPDPLRDTALVVRYTQGVLVGLALLIATSAVDIRRASHFAFSYLPLAAALVLALALIVFGSGPGASGARINLGPVQPIELIRLLLVLFLAGYFARRWELLRQLRAESIRQHRLPSWLNMPRADHMLPVLAGVAVALVLFFALKDLGPALLLSLLFLIMFAVARAGIGMATFGALLLMAGFYLGHALRISATLTERIAMWQSPWENMVRGGDQIAQAMWAMAAGAFAGTGGGLGATRYIPAGHTDLALAAIGEEFGVVGIAVVIAAFVALAWRGFHISRAATTDYGLFVALGMTMTLVVPVVVMGAGVLGLIPLTGVVTPFISYGGSAMAVNFCALGLLVACRSTAASGAPEVASPFVQPLRWVARTLAVACVVLCVAWARVQVVSADEFLVRPQLSQQADGGLRYQYNPRVLDAARLLSPGTVFDRDGVPLASGDSGVIKSKAESYARMGVSPDSTCAAGAARCYPLGGAAFHILGDSRSRLNWAATNSSYVERDAENLLRGFDDRAVAVKTAVSQDESRTALRRDYASLVPLVRHRWQPDHADVRALLDQPRDVRLTVDARLQLQVATILARAARSAGVAHAAAVVLDAATGEVLASVSYPWPGMAGAPVLAADAVFDRARYGLYPPGSTFKLVTAAAALRSDSSLATVPFVCSRLPNDRAGARIAGWGRPVRDDVLDRHPHGSIAMHDGIVRSCNAYFAQLAVHLGEDALAQTAGLAGIALSPGNDPARVRENLPHAGFGQGQVVTTPLRMARVAAAIASDGSIRETPIVATAAPLTTSFVTPAVAATLGGYMRDAVTDGSGRRLASHPGRVAGKTGTAEVDDKASHAWFVGYAPHGRATRRVAFAVLFENAGYGGAIAAETSGQIVTAAMSLGLVQ